MRARYEATARAERFARDTRHVADFTRDAPALPQTLSEIFFHASCRRRRLFFFRRSSPLDILSRRHFSRCYERCCHLLLVCHAAISPIFAVIAFFHIHHISLHFAF